MCVFEWGGGGVVGMGKGEMGDFYIIYIGFLKGYILKFLRVLLVVKKIIFKLVKIFFINF